MINFNTINTSQYQALRLDLLSRVEESGVLSQKPYLDSKGIPTIGVGMNLQSESTRRIVLDTIFGIIELSGDESAESLYRTEIASVVSQTYPKTKAGKELLQSNLNAVMARRAADSRITSPNKRSTFAFANDQEIADTFNTLSRSYEDQINSWLGNIPESQERAVLFSLAYNGILTESSSLKSAISSGNRPEAWYQIRYQSNGDHLNGIAKRRYYESQIFGLTDSTSVGVDEAKSVFRMYTSHRSKIKSYDQQYGSMIAQANSDYQTSVVQSFEDVSANARGILESTYSPAISADEILVDSSSNALSDTSAATTNTLMFGESGFDTYVFPSISGADEIIDSDNDGAIIIGGVRLDGESKPLLDAAQNIVPDSWVNNQFTLTKTGDDLVITKPSVTGSITIRNYPFTATKAFGFSLGKSIVPNQYNDPALQGIDSIFSNSIFPVNTPDGGFFGVAKQLIDRPADAYTSYSFVKYDNRGNKISQTSFNSALPTKQVLRPRSFLGTDNRQWTVIPFYCEPDSIQTGADLAKRSVGLCLVDDLGNVVNSRILATNTQLNGGFALTTTVNSVVSNSIFYFRIDGYNTYQIDIKTLADQNIQGASYDFITTDQAVDRSYAANSIQLRNGNKLSLIYNNQLTTSTPKLRDLTADEIIPNYYVSSGESITPRDTNFIAIIAENTESNLQISLNQNSVGVLMGLDSNPNAKISLPYDLSDAQIYSANDGQYSVDDLLAGKFVADSSALQTRRRRLDNAIGNTTLSDDLQYYGDYDDATTDDEVVSLDSISSHQQYSVIVLPNNQTIVLVGVNATGLVKAPENYFYQATQLTNDPTSQPTILKEPSSQPSLQLVVQTIVTNDPSSQPSQSPDALPTSTPSGKPNSIPSAVPSKQTLQPSTGINSQEPTSVPSVETQTPTNSESATPSADQSPSSRPSAKISSDTPTSQPSKKSKQPSSQPSETSTTSATSGQPTSIPSVETQNPTTNQPSSVNPTVRFTDNPIVQVTSYPTSEVSSSESDAPTFASTSDSPSSRPSNYPLVMPTRKPSKQTLMPSAEVIESDSPSSAPSYLNSPYPTSHPSKRTGFPSLRSATPTMIFTNNPIPQSLLPTSNDFTSLLPTSAPSFHNSHCRPDFPSNIVAPIAAAFLLAGVGLAYVFRKRIWANNNVEVAPANPSPNKKATRLVEVSPRQHSDEAQQNHSR